MDRHSTTSWMPEFLMRFKKRDTSCPDKHDFVKIFHLYAWSGSDLKQIQKEYLLKNLIPSAELDKVLEAWKDLQEEYDEAVHSPRPVALHKALASIGVEFDGKMHDALDDSRNTSKIFIELSNPEEFQKTVSYIHEYRDTDNRSVTLGDLFDFSKLTFTDSESA